MGVGIRDWFRRRPRGREYWVRPDFEQLPQEEWTDDEYDHWFAQQPEEYQWAHWEHWSRETVPHPRVKTVASSCLGLARAAASDSHPQEFAALLRVEDDSITELILLPGTVQGDEHAIFQMHMQPVDASIRGSLHSHPTPHPYPSDADLALFEKYGEIHIILGAPYGEGDWRAYDHTGQPVSLKVV